MSFHILLPRVLNLAEASRLAVERQSPRQGMALLADELGAQVHEPGPGTVLPTDKIRSLVLPPEVLWASARHVRDATGPADAIFCSSESGGFHLAAACGERSKRPRIAVFVHNADRPRARFALRFWKLADRVDLFLACAPSQVDFLRRYLRLPADRVRHVWDHTDTRFFTPGPQTATKARPLVVSVGLEQRDYKTLAAATADLDIDVKISGFSTDAAAMARTFPEELPSNMSRRFYAWPELVQLYRDADAIVVSCHENGYAAGVQSLMEATACRRPVIATATVGLRPYLDDAIVAVPPGDVGSMRAAIQQILRDKPAAEARADAGHVMAMRRFPMEQYVADIAGAMRALA